MEIIDKILQRLSSKRKSLSGQENPPAHPPVFVWETARVEAYKHPDSGLGFLETKE